MCSSPAKSLQLTGKAHQKLCPVIPQTFNSQIFLSLSISLPMFTSRLQHVLHPLDLYVLCHSTIRQATHPPNQLSHNLTCCFHYIHTSSHYPNINICTLPWTCTSTLHPVIDYALSLFIPAHFNYHLASFFVPHSSLLHVFSITMIYLFFYVTKSILKHGSFMAVIRNHVDSRLSGRIHKELKKRKKKVGRGAARASSLGSDVPAWSISKSHNHPCDIRKSRCPVQSHRPKISDSVITVRKSV